MEPYLSSFALQRPSGIKAQFSHTIAEVFAHPYDAASNTGIINAGVAHNHFASKLVAPLLHFTATHVYYEDQKGVESLRKGLAALMSRVSLVPLDPSNIVVSSGATAVLENLSLSICNPGDVILLPTPCYGALERDLAAKSRAVLKQVVRPPPDFHLSLETLTEVYQQVVADGGRVSALFIVNPDNPIGTVHETMQLCQLLQWCADRRVHLICDELYMLSVFGNVKFESIISINKRFQKLDPRLLHVVYGLTKDFGLSGYRIGCLYSENEDIRNTVCKTFATAVASPIQYAVAGLLQDQQAVTNIIERNQQQLLQNYLMVTECLRCNGIPFCKANGGFFVWIDLRQVTRCDQLCDDLRLCKSIVSHGVYLTPGALLFSNETGWFRVCFGLAEDELRALLSRLTTFWKGNAIV